MAKKKLSVGAMLSTKSRAATSSHRPEPGMVKGLAGQWTYTADARTMLLRVLTTGTLSDTYYLGRSEVVQEAKDVVLGMAKADPLFLAKAAVWASEDGRALNNTMPVLALADGDAAGRVAERLTDARAIEKAKVLPFQIYDALSIYKAGGRGGRSKKGESHVFEPNRVIVEALQTALEASFVNWGTLTGHTAVLVDVSGSMQCAIKDGSTATAVGVASLLAAAVAKAGEEATVVRFDTAAEFVAASRKDTLDALAARICANGGGTDLSCGFKLLLKTKVKPDTVIAFTDNMSWAGDLSIDMIRLFRRETGVRTIILVTLLPYRDMLTPIHEPGVFQVAGWSPALGPLIKRIAAGEGDHRSAVEAIDLTAPVGAPKDE